MGKRWNQERKEDPYYQKAKKEEYRSRASYKLLQLNKKFKIIRKGDRILDLGAAPGGWSQVALEAVGEEGRVVAVDLQRIRPFTEENFKSIKGDFTTREVKEEIISALEGQAAVILSDASPKLSGIKDVDQMRSMDLFQAVMEMCDSTLRYNGSLIMKLFQGPQFPEMLKTVKKKFRMVKTTKPPSSRKKSVEMYLVARGFRGTR
ncbi:RlmE family RNA methyltransferase [Methanobacterium sp. CWC-01]|uniref:RlmE family RNA methyltransferase n=1 Tax=Methanobacterium aridiramus TaxID=2584467 RepID=UPI002574B30F|nr:RlmE family RNA methyltransferase [Methanobacterium sp. CWC-01]WJI09930.1 RlmE family RNA methyltransferase [Methanobacterium sp. CWC-01]